MISLSMAGPLALGSRGYILELLSDTGLFGWFILIVLLAFLTICTGIIADKLMLMRKARAQSAGFLRVFRESDKFSEVKAACRAFPASPQAGLFLAGVNELEFQLKHPNPAPPAEARGPRPVITNMEAIHRALSRASAVEISKLERTLNFLATTASAAPFIGLAGTVVGIMNAFHDIGEMGSAGLATVAPGISEALVTTAMGLLTAIPAVIAYNFLVNRIKVTASEMDDFSLEFISIAERNFT